MAIIPTELTHLNRDADDKNKQTVDKRTGRRPIEAAV